MDLLHLRFVGVETGQADFNAVLVEKIFERLDRLLVLLVADQVHTRRAVTRRTMGWHFVPDLLALPPRPQQHFQVLERVGDQLGTRDRTGLRFELTNERCLPLVLGLQPFRHPDQPLERGIAAVECRHLVLQRDDR